MVQSVGASDEVSGRGFKSSSGQLSIATPKNRSVANIEGFFEFTIESWSEWDLNPDH